MKRIWEVIKKIFVWLGAVFVAIFTVLFCKEVVSIRPSDYSTTDGDDEEDSDEINRRAAKKREEAIARIERADARTLAESYGPVCDAIADGKERFRRRVSTGSTTGSRADD